MTPRLPSPPLIKGIVSRPPNEVNYSTLNGKNMETRKQPGNEIRQKFKKYRLNKRDKYVKENTGKYECLMELAKKYVCKIPLIKKDVESDGKEGAETEDLQGNKIRRVRFQKEFKLNKMERKMKEGKHTGKIKNLMEPSDGNKRNCFCYRTIYTVI